MNRRKKKINVSQIVLAAFLLLLGLICVYPMWYTFIVSFSDKAKVTALLIIVIFSILHNDCCFKKITMSFWDR